MSHRRFHPIVLLLAGIFVAPVLRAEGLETELENYRLVGRLDKVLSSLAEQTATPIEPDWTALAEVGVTPETPVALKGRRIQADDLLDLALLQVMKSGKPLGWFHRDDGTIVVTTQRRAIRRQSAEAPSKTAASSRRSASQPATRPANPRRVPLVRMNVNNVTLGELVAFLRELTGMNIAVNWKALALKQIHKDDRISLQVDRATVGKVLDLALAEVNSDKDTMNRAWWIVHEGVLHISTGEELNRKRITRTYDIQDLLQPRLENAGLLIATNQAYVQDLVPVVGESAVAYKPQVGYVGTGTQLSTGTGLAETSSAEQRARTIEQITRTIKASIGQDMWQPVGKGTITFFDGRLFVTQTLLGWKLMEQAEMRRIEHRAAR